MDLSSALPYEIWLYISRYMVNPDLKNLRLVGNHHIASIASSLLFTTAYVATRRGVLDTFTALINHPVLRNHVKELIFDSSSISENVVSDHQSEEYGPALAAFLADQEHIRKHELLPRLENALQHLPNLGTVRYADLSRVSYLPGDQASSGICGDVILFCRSDPLSHKSEEIEDPGSLVPAPRYQVWYPSLGIDQDRQPLGLDLLIEALAKHQLPALQNLSLGDRSQASEDGGIPHWAFMSYRPASIITKLSCIFPTLSKLELNVSTITALRPVRPRRLLWQSPTWTLRDSWLESGLAQVLSLAKNLEDLKLAGWYGLAYLSFDETISTSTWPKLRTLDLSYFEASADETQQFIKRHARSLSRMTLDRFNLKDGSWHEVGEQISLIAPDLKIIVGLLSFEGVDVVPDHRAFQRIDSELDMSCFQNEIGPEDESGDDEEDGLEDESDDGEEDEIQWDAWLEDAICEDGSTSEELEYSSDDSGSDVS